MEAPDEQWESGRVLIADDDDDLRILLGAHLRKCGYRVVEFDDGAGLLDYVGSAMSQRPQAIMPTDQLILDVKMPGLSGLQILTSLRLAGWTNPIVLVTALSAQEIDSDAQRLGANAVVHKPFSPHEIARIIEHFAHSPAPDGAPRSNSSRHLCT